MSINFLNMLIKLKAVLIIVLLFVDIAQADTTDELIIKLQSPDHTTRMKAVENLGEVMDNKTIDAIKKVIFVKAEDWKIKIKAIHLLGEVRDPKVSEFIVRVFNDAFLNEMCPAIQWHAVVELGKKFNKGSKVVDSLIDALNNDDSMILEAVIQSLGKIGDQRATPFLIEKLNDKRFLIKLGAIKALRDIGDPIAIPFLKRIADDDDNKILKEEATSILKKFHKISFYR